MTDQTLYEIADDFVSLMDLLDDATAPKRPCPTCNSDGDDFALNLRKTAAGEDWVPCPTCGDTGWLEPMDDDALLEAIENAMADIEMSLSQKVENIMRLIQSWDVMEAAIKAEEDRLRARRKTFENKRQRLRSYLAKHMKRTGQKKIETTIKNAHLYAGRKTVVIDDEMELPQGTFDTEMIIKPDKKIIGERLKQDIATPGARLETGDDYVVFR